MIGTVLQDALVAAKLQAKARSEVQSELLGNRVQQAVSQTLVRVLVNMYRNRRLDTRLDRERNVRVALDRAATEVVDDFVTTATNTAIAAYEAEVAVFMDLLPMELIAKASGVAVPDYMTEAQLPEMRVSPSTPVARVIVPEKYRQRFGELVFPTLNRSFVREVLEHRFVEAGPHWRDRLMGEISDDRRSGVIDTVAAAIQNGESEQELALSLESVLRSGSAKSREISRRTLLWVHNQAARQAWEPLQRVIAGVMFVAVLDERTRDEHALRHGRVHWKDGRGPRDNPYRWDAFPVLPDAPWCRCTDAPVFDPPEEITPEEVQQFQSEKGPIPDPDSMIQWWNGASDGERIKHVGSRRYAAMAHRLQLQPMRYSHFVDPDTMRLLSASQIASESEKEFAERTRRVAAIVSARQVQFGRMRQLGFVRSVGN